MKATEVRKNLQILLGVSADGQIGAKSRTAFERLANAPADSEWPIVEAVWPIEEPEKVGNVDSRSEANIATLHRLVQPKARQLLLMAAAKGMLVKVTSGTRTYAEQDKLFAQGGVTKARGGQSNHNFGLAFDITLFQGSSPIWESPKYKEIGQLGKSIGLTWGGDWTSIVDEPHFELHPPWAEGMSESKMLEELRNRHANGTDVFAS